MTHTLNHVNTMVIEMTHNNHTLHSGAVWQRAKKTVIELPCRFCATGGEPACRFYITVRIPKHKLSNAKYTLDVLEAAWVLEQCKVEGGLSSEHCASIARRFVAYCLACKIVRSLLRA